MRGRALLVLLLLGSAFALGCQAIRSTVPAVSVGPGRYDALWRATVEVMKDHFPLVVTRKSEGVIISDYQVGGSLLEPWAMEARQPYYQLEETLHVIRRRGVARLVKEDSGYTLHVEVIKERQAYAGPDHAFITPYDLHDLTFSEREQVVERAPAREMHVRPFGQSPAGDTITGRQQEALAQRRGRAVLTVEPPRPLSAREASLTWYRLEDDADLAREIVAAVERRLGKISPSK